MDAPARTLHTPTPPRPRLPAVFRRVDGRRGRPRRRALHRRRGGCHRRRLGRRGAARALRPCRPRFGARAAARQPAGQAGSEPGQKREFGCAHKAGPALRRRGRGAGEGGGSPVLRPASARRRGRDPASPAAVLPCRACTARIWRRTGHWRPATSSASCSRPDGWMQLIERRPPLCQGLAGGRGGARAAVRGR
jgi:hypothetical protein